MGITLGRHRGAPAVGASANEQLRREFERVRDKRLTGRVSVVDASTGSSGDVYLFEGAAYAVDLHGFTARVGQRLAAGQRLSAAQARELEGRGDPIDAARWAVVEQLVPTEALASVHQELTIAALGALLALAKAKVGFHRNDTTGRLCTLPMDWDAVVASVDLRRTRLADDWSRIDATSTPATCVLRPTGDALPPHLALPEFTSALSALDGQRSVDAVAAELGFTRAEAVHIAAALVTCGAAAVDHADPGAVPSTLLVPEAFGEHAVVAAPVVSAAAVALEPEPEPIVLEPEPEPEPVVLVEPVVLEPEPVVLEPEPEPDPLSDFALAALRGELAAAEAWAAELRTRIARAEQERAATDD